MGTIVYRVYEPFHDPAESGTVEYGVYSTLEKALARVGEAWQTNKYPEPETKNEHGWYLYSTFDTFRIAVAHIEVDKDSQQKEVGYT